jgi:5-methylthioadenosine/S-adenosylhomocysteine deaminase
MATLNGARALGLADRIGSLEIGKSADIVAIDLHRPETLPVYHPISQIVYAAGREQVTQVWVAGRRVLRDGTLTTVDLEQTLAGALEWGERLRDFD